MKFPTPAMVPVIAFNCFVLLATNINPNFIGNYRLEFPAFYICLGQYLIEAVCFLQVN